MSKQVDWAEKKALKYLRDVLSVCYEHDDYDAKRLAKLLRAERARAVRVCKRISSEVNAGADERLESYKLACDDCAAAIKGVQRG